jgi:hypothetical protein
MMLLTVRQATADDGDLVALVELDQWFRCKAASGEK